MPRRTKDERHVHNPFRHDVISHTIRGTRAIYASPVKENNFAMVSRETGEDFGNIAFGKRVVVDKTNFLKFYAAGVKMFLNLKNPGVKVFMLIYDMLMDNKNYQTDKIELVYEILEENIQAQIKRSTFYRGINELIEANFLAPSYIDGIYWINCDYVFRGDRLTLVNEYLTQERLEHEQKWLADAKAEQKQLEPSSTQQDAPTLADPDYDIADDD